MTSPNVLLSEALQLEVGGKFNTFYWNISNKININFLILIYSKRTLAWRCQIISTIWSGTSVNSRQLEYFSCPGLFEYVQFGIHNWNACECWTYVSFRYEIILNLFPFLICQRSKSSHIFFLNAFILFLGRLPFIKANKFVIAEMDPIVAFVNTKVDITKNFI